MTTTASRATAAGCRAPPAAGRRGRRTRPPARSGSRKKRRVSGDGGVGETNEGRRRFGAGHTRDASEPAYHGPGARRHALISSAWCRPRSLHERLTASARGSAARSASRSRSSSCSSNLARARSRASRERCARPGTSSSLAPRSLRALVPASGPPGSARRSPLFGASFFLYGFHSYRLPNQVFELLVTALALVLLLRRRASRRSPRRGGAGLVLPLFAAVRAHGDVLAAAAAPRGARAPLLPRRRRLRAGDPAVRFPKDPLYPIASVNRLWLFLLFAVLLSSQPDAASSTAGSSAGSPGPRSSPSSWASSTSRACSRSRATTSRTSSTAPSTGGSSPPSATPAGSPASSPARCPSCCSSCGRRARPSARWRSRLSSRCAPRASSSRAPGPRGSPGSSLIAVARRPALSLSRRRGPPAPVAGSASSGWRSAPRSPRSRCSLAAALLARAPRPGGDAAAPPGRLEGLSREMQIRGLGPHVAAARGGRVRDRARAAEAAASASDTRASTCTCAPSSTMPGSACRARRQHRGRARRRARPSSTTATTPTCRS